MGKICPLGDAQFIQQYLPAKIQRQGCVRVAIDAPALVGILAVGAVLKNAVDGVAGGKHRLAAGFHVGAGMGVKTGVAMLVIAVEGQIPPGGDLLRQCQPCADDMAAAHKALGGVGDGLLPEGNVEIDLPLDHIHKGFGHGILELDDAVLAGMVDLQCHPVAGLVAVGVNKGYSGVGVAGHQSVADFVQNFQLDGLHDSSP